eukprot:2639218-Rhodomonas_salina.2
MIAGLDGAQVLHRAVKASQSIGEGPSSAFERRLDVLLTRVPETFEAAPHVRHMPQHPPLQPSSDRAHRLRLRVRLVARCAALAQPMQLAADEVVMAEVEERRRVCAQLVRDAVSSPRAAGRGPSLRSTVPLARGCLLVWAVERNRHQHIQGPDGESDPGQRMVEVGSAFVPRGEVADPRERSDGVELQAMVVVGGGGQSVLDSATVPPRDGVEGFGVGQQERGCVSVVSDHDLVEIVCELHFSLRVVVHAERVREPDGRLPLEKVMLECVPGIPGVGPEVLHFHQRHVTVHQDVVEEVVPRKPRADLLVQPVSALHQRRVRKVDHVWVRASWPRLFLPVQLDDFRPRRGKIRQIQAHIALHQVDKLLLFFGTIMLDPRCTSRAARLEQPIVDAEASGRVRGWTAERGGRGESSVRRRDRATSAVGKQPL